MPVPESFGHQGAYKVVSELGRGGFATVYKAYQASLDRHVAIKVLRPEVVQDETGLERFQREARAAARLGGHPNIVTIYDYDQQSGMAYLALEFIDGSTLQERLAQPLSATEIDRIITGVASALDYAHEHQLVHRDVKPSNVLVGKDGRVVLSDFGIAKLLDAATALTGAAIGTPEYMAPEQITGAQVDARSDIYSLGVMVYRVFAGKPPFQGNLMSVLHRHVHETPPPMADSGRRIPSGVEEVVQRALAKDPAQR
jgi:eukaryotic-like serine/threonine-protein kinase